MNIALWIVQGLLALAYLASGASKLTQPVAKLGERMKWVYSVPQPLVRFIGLAELLGAIGLILPLATNILPWLTPAAAVGLVVVQVSAIAFHISRREYRGLPANIILLLLAAIILIGRTALLPA